MTTAKLTQAVILAGGRGSRLSPLTDTCPKPLIAFHGQPFLWHLLQQLKSQGIEDVLILVGYLAEQIIEYCGDGQRWGLNIRCIQSPEEAETGQRLMDAAPYIESHFLLMYCDNYWPMNLDRMWGKYRESGALAMITVYANRDGYTTNNILADDQGSVTAYDPARQVPGLNGVEIGYALVAKEVLEYLPPGNPRFEHEVYPQLSQQGLLSAFWTEHRYYSVGSLERLPLTEAFLRPQRAVLLDRDGVLNERPPQAQYVESWEQFRWLPGSVEALSLLEKQGYKLILVTNQPGIARGMLTEKELADLHGRMSEELAHAGVHMDAIYHCAHGWDEGCFCRKPSPGMLFQAQRDFHLDLTQTLFIGDDPRDQEAGEAAGCVTKLVSPDFTLLDVVRNYLSTQEVNANA